MIAVPEVGCAACQLSPAPIFAMVVGQGAIVHHHRDVREHTLRPRHQLLHGQPNLWEAVGAPIPGGPTVPRPGRCPGPQPSGQLPGPSCPVRGKRQRHTSVVSSLGYVSKKMAKPWKLSLLPNTGPGIRRRCSHNGRYWGCSLVPEGQSNTSAGGGKKG